MHPTVIKLLPVVIHFVLEMSELFHIKELWCSEEFKFDLGLSGVLGYLFLSGEPDYLFLSGEPDYEETLIELSFNALLSNGSFTSLIKLGLSFN